MRLVHFQLERGVRGEVAPGTAVVTVNEIAVTLVRRFPAPRRGMAGRVVDDGQPVGGATDSLKGQRQLGGIGELAAWVFYGIICFWNTATLTVLPTALLFMQFVTPPNDQTSEKLPHARALDN